MTGHCFDCNQDTCGNKELDYIRREIDNNRNNAIERRKILKDRIDGLENRLKALETAEAKRTKKESMVIRPKQKQVLKMLDDGKTTREMAQSMQVSETAVRRLIQRARQVRGY
jgi:DNA-binding NarL/FixJ family response regulator